MDIFNFEVSCHIAGNFSGRYSAIAFDGRFYYLTLPSRNEIHTFDMCCQKIDCIQTQRGYDALCYDECSKCFWATLSRGQCIYKLDPRCVEIDCIKINSKYPLAALTGISCTSNPDDLLIATTGWIAVTKKTHPHETNIVKEIDSAIRVGVAASCERMFYLVCGGHGDTITAVSHGREQVYALPADYRVSSITAGGIDTLYVLASKYCRYPCIIKCTPICCTDTCCNPCPKPCPDPHPQPIDCRRGAGDIIESIALVEASLSHILNAEGEKLQKALECSDDIGELLKVNESIRETITSVTHMEHVLYDKLRLAESLCSKPDPGPRDQCQNEF